VESSDDHLHLSIRTDIDIVRARQEGRRIALEVGFSQGDGAVVSAAISEIARNMLQYAQGGEIRVTAVEDGGRRGIEVVCVDAGPGIPDIRLALQDGYSTSGGLGLGLPGARRLMDDFDVRSELGKGTIVSMRKWRR
jgi:serine/threonine-protein kinase RsbT